MITKKNSEKEIVEFLNKKYPKEKAEKWDFVGYSIKANNKVVEKILVCLDVNKFSVDEAIKKKANLIISFHPFRFAKKWDEVYEYDPTKKDLVKKLEKNNISVFSIHTNFDQDKNGTKYWLARELGLENKIKKLNKFSVIISYRCIFLNLINLLKDRLEINSVWSNYHGSYSKFISNICIYPGAGDIYDFLKIYKKEKIDMLITSDIKWNEQQILNSLNIKFLMIPHKVEDVFVKAMKSIIGDKFKDIEIIEHKNKDFIKGY